MNPEQKELLQSMIKTLQLSVTKAEFTKNFEQIIALIKALKKQNTDDFTEINRIVEKKLKEVSETQSTDFSTLKNELSKTVSDQVSNMYSDWAKMSDKIQERIAELKDGEDADEQKVCDMVLAQMPKPEPQPKCTPEETRNKLETLTGDERLDKSAIKGIDEALAQIASTGKATFVSGTAKPIRLTNDGTLIDKNIRNLNFKGTAVTSIVRNADGTIDITLDAGAGSTTPVNNEVVSGSGTTFTLAYTPTVGSVNLYGYGQRLTLTEDYTISGKNITTINSFDAGKILADYRY